MKSASPSLLTYAVIYLIFLYAPILLLPIFAFNDSAIIALPCPVLPSTGFICCGRPRPFIRRYIIH